MREGQLDEDAIEAVTDVVGDDLSADLQDD
jgi:hypothetical protein